MTRIWNFSAGPATLPEAVLREAQAELLDWHGVGASIVEMSHRGKYFSEVLETAKADLRALLAIPENYRVLFLQGGATLQFSAVPMNLLAGRRADYVATGAWSKKAWQEAARIEKVVGKVRLAATTEAEGQPAGGFCRFPRAEEMRLDPEAAYLHVCTNETIHGVEVHDDALLPQGAPVVADMSSHILSRPVDIRRYGLIYAGAQKNIGPSGMTLVIVREDLLGQADANVTPRLLDYQTQAENDSML
ncbi:MAG: 3-phosphoserine/phosphohydroxythreonine transaminase, partial [Zoogloeaceae bacterium]|nr:3-phosphoserine/phosphohydroxythreonine transaminase [Zoogloeaceae bacterium]